MSVLYLNIGTQPNIFGVQHFVGAESRVQIKSSNLREH